MALILYVGHKQSWPLAPRESTRNLPPRVGLWNHTVLRAATLEAGINAFMVHGDELTFIIVKAAIASRHASRSGHLREHTQELIGYVRDTNPSLPIVVVSATEGDWLRLNSAGLATHMHRVVSFYDGHDLGNQLIELGLINRPPPLNVTPGSHTQ